MADDNNLNAHVAKIWSSYLGREVTADEVRLLLTLRELGRIELGQRAEPSKADISGPVIQGC